jgi:hypothetical protein
MKACSGVFPIEELAKGIEAHAIIVMSAESTLNAVGVAEGRVPMYAFPGRPSDDRLEELSREIYARFIA